jgi:hypothetical protein
MTEDLEGHCSVLKARKQASMLPDVTERELRGTFQSAEFDLLDPQSIKFGSFERNSIWLLLRLLRISSTNLLQLCTVH